MSDTTAAIRDLNDRFRTTLEGGQVVSTRVVADLGFEFVAKALTAVREFKDFNEDNDPHGEHDFGAVTVDGEKCFWKIDYYDLTMSFGAERPDGASQTKRVLTIMLAVEY